jgi:hypothetical protein
MKHIHAELIKAWADGAEIEARYLKASGWTEWRLEKGGFIWYDLGAEYRIKPEPIIREEYLVRFDNEQGMFYPCQQETSYGQIKLTYKDNILINAEVIK